MQRLSYVGELGWELFIPASDAVSVFAALQYAGAEYDLCNVGLHALNSLRLEKGFRHWGHDVAAEDNLLQAGLSFTAKPDASDFIGRDAFVAAGYLSSGMYGHTMGAAIGMGYVNVPGLNAAALAEADFQIEVATVPFAAKASLRALHDPDGGKMRG